MKVNVQQIHGNWDLGYSLDKHKIKSVFKGHSLETGRPLFDTLRTDAGEALFQLKYRSDLTQIKPIAEQIKESIVGYFPTASIVIPVPPSRNRVTQPVHEIAKNLASSLQLYYTENLISKNNNAPQMKDLETKEEKIKALSGAFSINDILNNGKFDIIIVDDLYDTGTSLEAITSILRGYAKIGNIFVATVTRKQ